MTLTTATGVALILSTLIYHGGLAYLLFLLVLSFSHHSHSCQYVVGLIHAQVRCGET